MVKVEFTTDNAAFEDCLAEQCAATLRVIADQIDAGHIGGKIRDANGNTIGQWYAHE